MWEAVEQMAVACTAVCTALPCGRWNATFGILGGPAHSAPCKHLGEFFAVVLSDDAKKTWAFPRSGDQIPRWREDEKGRTKLFSRAS